MPFSLPLADIFTPRFYVYTFLWMHVVFPCVLWNSLPSPLWSPTLSLNCFRQNLHKCLCTLWKGRNQPVGFPSTIDVERQQYSTVGCRRTGGRRSQPGSFLFFTTPANLVLILQSVFESRRLACSAHTVCDDARRRSGVVSKSAMPPKKSSSQQTLFACGETVLNSFFQPGVVLLFRWNSSPAVLRQTVLWHPTVLYSL